MTDYTSEHGGQITLMAETLMAVKDFISSGSISIGPQSLSSAF